MTSGRSVIDVDFERDSHDKRESLTNNSLFVKYLTFVASLSQSSFPSIWFSSHATEVPRYWIFRNAWFVKRTLESPTFRDSEVETIKNTTDEGRDFQHKQLNIFTNVNSNFYDFYPIVIRWISWFGKKIENFQLLRYRWDENISLKVKIVSLIFFLKRLLERLVER